MTRTALPEAEYEPQMPYRDDSLRERHQPLYELARVFDHCHSCYR